MKLKLLEAVSVAVLLTSFIVSAALQISSTSPTYDEPVHVAAGYSYAKWGDYRLNPEHPPLIKLMAALPLRFAAVTPSTPPTIDAAGDPSLTELGVDWAAALADPGAEWTFAHTFLYGMRGSALARLQRASTYEVNGTDAVMRGDFHNDADAIVRKARWMIVPFGVLLALLVYAWSRQLFGPAGAIVSLTLLVFEPSLVAHSALVTTDVPITLCLFGSVYFFWRAMQRFSWPDSVAFVLFTAAAFVVKYSAIVLVPLLLVFLLMQRSRRAFALVATAALATYIAIWGVYGWRYSAAVDPSAAASAEQAVAPMRPLPALPERAPGRFPLQYSLLSYSATSRFIEVQNRVPTPDEATEALRYARMSMPSKALLAIDRFHLLPEAYTYGAAFARERSVIRPSYLRGQHSDRGFPSYFFWTFLLKTPLPTLVILVISTWVLLRSGPRHAARFTWVAVLVYLGFALSSNLNIGHRHLLPMLPFLFVTCGALALRWRPFPLKWRVVSAASTLLLVALSGLFVVSGSGVSSVVSDRLAYMNELAGGPAGGYLSLVDSNFDWGQDLPKLRTWLDEHRIAEPISLFYFGSADPRYYGIRHRNVLAGYPFEPDDGFTPGGLFAVSATQLVGSGWDPAARDEWSRFLSSSGAELVGRAGYSILIYRLPLR